MIVLHNDRGLKCFTKICRITTLQADMLLNIFIITDSVSSPSAPPHSFIKCHVFLFFVFFWGGLLKTIIYKKTALHHMLTCTGYSLYLQL